MNFATSISYALVTFGATIPFYWYINRKGGIEDRRFESRYRLMLWIPALTAFAFRVYSGEGFSNLYYGAGRWSLMLIALLLPLLVELILITLAIALRWAKLSTEVIKFEPDGVRIGQQLGLMFGGESQSFIKFAANLLVSIMIGSVFSMLFTFGAEFGWRGYLLPHSIDELGLNDGFVVTGIIWGFWHLPLVLMGFRYPKYSRLGGFVLMPVSTISLTIVTGILYFATQSIWAPTLLHGSLLVTTNLSRVGLGDQGDDLRVQVLGIILWIVAATTFYLWWV